MRPATAARCAGPCRSGPRRSELAAAKISTAASVAIGISPTTPENRTRISSIQMPEKIDAQRVRPPAATFSAVWPTEPPTGWPRNSPEAMFPTPCAMKSRFGSDRDPPGFGAASATPVPWTSTITATAAAAAIRSSDESSDSCGRCGVGMPLGILPESSTRTRLLAPSVSTVGIASATNEATEAIRVRLSTIISRSADTPTAAAVSDISLGWVTTFQALTTAGLPVCGEPRRSPSWPSTMLTATPVRNPVSTDTETKRVKRPQRSTPAMIIITPASADSTNSASGRSAPEKPLSAEPAASAAAVVVVTTISRVLTARPPPIGPAMLAYSP